jgi:hypothetical protein
MYFGFLVPGVVMTPIGALSSPASMAIRIRVQNANLTIGGPSFFKMDHGAGAVPVTTVRSQQSSKVLGAL